jgi:hypothetical protein
MKIFTIGSISRSRHGRLLSGCSYSWSRSCSRSWSRWNSLAAGQEIGGSGRNWSSGLTWSGK